MALERETIAGGPAQRRLPRSSMDKVTTSSAGSPRILARYQCDEGARHLVGQRINGTVALSDVPAGKHGRVYLIERHLPSKAELDGLIADYLALANELNRPPLRAPWLGRLIDGAP
jgi:hypothetical protein